MKMRSRWQMHFAIMTVPFGIPLAAGTYWLWLHHMLIVWVGISAVLGVLWWLFNQGISRLNADMELIDISASFEKTEQTQKAYEQIKRISAARRKSNPDLASAQFYMETLFEVMQSVAEQFYPQRKDAMLEIKVPYLLKAIEMLAQELRINLSENVPGSHMLSLNDIARSRRLANRGREIYRLFRIVTAGIDPVSSMIREIKILTNDSVLAHSAADLKHWLIDAYIKKIGYYAVELYSGNLVLENEFLFAKTTTRPSQKEMDNIKHRETVVSAEPFRILVLGQTNAGKSSLINALFGVKKAETDAIPTTEGITSFHLDRPGLDNAIILDCEGYGSDDCRRLMAKTSQEITRSDLILLAVSATNAAREPDKKMLQTIKDCFAEKNMTTLPPIVAALTHIDQLRPFREWNPPYDVRNPASAKDHAIKLMMETVAKDLNLTLDQIAPINLKTGFEYNVEEGLVPAIFQQLDQAKQVRYLRCLKEYQKKDQWRRLWQQSKRAGRFIAKQGFGVFDKSPDAQNDATECGGENPLTNPAYQLF